MSGGNALGIALGVVVIATLLALLVARNVTVRVDPEPDYADLAPAPGGTVWQAGEERTLWLSTNRHAVDVRIDGIALGLGEIERSSPLGSGVTVLGYGPGCLDWVVDSLTATPQPGGQWQVTGTVDRGPGTTGPLSVHARVYDPVDQAAFMHEFNISVQAGSGAFSHDLILSGDGDWRLDASHGDHYLAAATRSVLFNTEETTEAVLDSGEREFHMLANTGLGLVACGEQEDVTISLHGDGGEEMNRYLVDIEAAAPAPPQPPDFGVEYVSLRFCADAASPRGSVLSGGEEVGSITATGQTALAYSLGAAGGGGPDYAFFEIDESSGAITVSDLGADDTTGMDGASLYSFTVRARDDGGRTAEAAAVVQLVLSSVSTAGDGRCP